MPPGYVSVSNQAATSTKRCGRRSRTVWVAKRRGHLVVGDRDARVPRAAALRKLLQHTEDRRVGPLAEVAERRAAGLGRISLDGHVGEASERGQHLRGVRDRHEHRAIGALPGEDAVRHVAEELRLGGRVAPAREHRDQRPRGRRAARPA